MQKEFSYPLIVADLPLSEQHYKMRADDNVKPFLSQVLQVKAVKMFDADFWIKPDRSTSILQINGHIKTELVLQSVVSLEEFTKSYDFDFTTSFDTKATLNSQKEDGDDWDTDTPEIVVDGKIDLGDVAIEQVALRLDYYPRQEGEEFYFKSEFDDDETVGNHPFAALKKLKK